MEKSHEVAQGAQTGMELVGYANFDQLDNMLDDRTATLHPKKTGFAGTPVYRARMTGQGAQAGDEQEYQELPGMWEQSDLTGGETDCYPKRSREETIDEREAFDKWRYAQADSLRRCGHPDGAQAFINLGSVQWAGWQARAALATQPSTAEPVYQCKKKGGIWHECSKVTYNCVFAGEEFEKRILFTAPPAAAPVAAGEPIAWMHEDELPEGYPYDAMFPFSKVDFVRMFPVFGPPAAAHGDEIESLAVNRYRPTPDGLLHYKVVAGDGRRSLFTGTKAQCYFVAAKLTEAFLDGAYVQNSAAHGDDGRTCRFCQKRFDSAGDCGNHVDQFHHGEAEPAPQGDEAVRKDATESAIQRACDVLPEDWTMQIDLERGAGCVALFNPWGSVVDFGQDFESIGAEVEAAIAAAMRAQAGEGGEV